MHNEWHSWLRVVTINTLLMLLSVAFSQAETPNYDDTFPPAIELWRADSERMAAGLIAADALRLRWLTTQSGQQSAIHQLTQQMAAFQSAVEKNSSLPIKISNFKFDEAAIRAQWEGQARLEARTQFDAFNGHWFGLWDIWPMKHDWKPSELFQPFRTIARSPQKISALQYAWIGNGFGWNYVAQLGGDKEHSVILGMVYYLDGPPYDHVVGQKPHVGFADGPSRLIWVTEQEVFFEERQHSERDDTARYHITALYHNLLSDSPMVSQDAVQATYTRDAQDRPPFTHFKWSSELKP